jgi:hypothetical protein
MPAIAGCRNSSVITNSYASYADARAAGALQSGWIPYLPPGAHDIRSAHDPNGRGRWGLFSFTTADEPLLRNELPQQASWHGVVVDAPARIEWWPVLLRGTFDDRRANDATTTGLEAYRRGDLIYAVNWNQRRAYYFLPNSSSTASR